MHERASEHGAPERWDLRFVHRCGYASHYDHRSRTSSWPLPMDLTHTELAQFGEAQRILRDEPAPGDLAALPAQARAATLAALRSPDPAAHSRLIREVVRTILTVQLQEHREAMLRATGGGALPSESSVDLAADEAFGQETIELIKQSRERRAGLQR